MDSKHDTSDVERSFEFFLEELAKVRRDNNLSGEIKNPHEVCNAMTDKHGRVCREVKHFERNDARPGWPVEAGEEISGYMAYAFMLADHYGIDIVACFCSELEKAIEQHGGKDDN